MTKPRYLSDARPRCKRAPWCRRPQCGQLQQRLECQFQQWQHQQQRGLVGACQSVERMVLTTNAYTRHTVPVRLRFAALHVAGSQSLCHKLLAQPVQEWCSNPAAVAGVPPHKRLCNARQGHGLPIGNLTSQFDAKLPVWWVCTAC